MCSASSACALAAISSTSGRNSRWAFSIHTRCATSGTSSSFATCWAKVASTHARLIPCLARMRSISPDRAGFAVARLITRARTLYLTVLDLLDRPELLQPPPVSDILPNPVVIGLRRHAEIQLVTMRNARDIAGLLRVQGSQQPTVYRYTTLIDRAKQMVALAQQMESSFLAALEKFDAEKYAALRAQQDLESAGANVTLQNLKVQEAADSVTLAADQIKRASDQVGHWQNLIDSDITRLEDQSIDLQYAEAGLQAVAGVLYLAAGTQSGFSLAGLATSEGNATQSLAQVSRARAAAAGPQASARAAKASCEENQI